MVGSRLSLALILTLAATLTAGCARQLASAPASGPRTLSLGYYGAGPGGQNLFRLVLTTDGFLRNTDDGRHEPFLAESWEIEEDGYLLTVRLRRDARFADGVELNAQIAKDFLDGARQDPRLRQLYPTLSDIRTIEVVGLHVLGIRLDRPSARMLVGDLTLGIERTVDGERFGVGPFVLESETQDLLTLVANPDYYGGRPSIDVVNVRRYATLRTAWAAMMRDDIDVLHDVPISAREFVQAESSVDLYTLDRPYEYLVGFNLTHDALGKQQVRQALNYAVDRRVLVERGLRGYGRSASGVWSQHWVYRGVERAYRYDPELADQLLTLAGYPLPTGRPSGSGDAMPARLRFTCLVFAGSLPDEIALLVQRQLYEIGVDMQLVALPPAEFGARVVAGDYDAAMVRQIAGRTLARAYGFWHSSSPQPSATFGYTETDDVLDRLRDAPTEEDVVRAALEFQEILFEDPPAIFLAIPTQARAVKTRFRIRAVQGQDIIPTIWQWQIAEASD